MGLTLALLTACTTVGRPTTATLREPAGVPSAPSAGTPVAGGAPGVSAPLPGTSAVAGGGVPGTIVPDAPAGLPGGAAAGTTGQVVGPKAAGRVCTSQVKIGVSYSSDVGTAVGALGGGAASGRAGNYAEALKRMYQLGADDLNRRGGIAGCKVVLAYHDFKVASADGNDAQSQQECADFADDQKVFAVHPAWLETKVLVSCLHSRRVPVFPGQEMTFLPTTKDFARYRGTLYGPTHIGVDRLGPVVDRLHANGFFGAGAKVGILIDNDSEGTNRHLVEALWKPRLKALRVPLASTFTYTHGDTSWMSAAVVQFKADGVTHVLTTADSGGAVLLFTPVADSQGYHPKLGLTSISGAQKLKLSFLPAASKVGAMAVSWWSYDFAAGDGVGWDKPPPNPARQRCVSIYRDAASANGIGLTALFAWCDMLEVLYAAFAGTSSPPTYRGLLQGVDRLNGSFHNAAGFERTLLGRERYDGGNLVRLMRWNTSKKNWDYFTAPSGLNP